MFSNLNWYNVVVLLLLALFIFGDKLPQMISDGLRMLRNLRRMAQNATSDLGRELGTDLQLEDLHPKTFLRKHLLSEAEQDALTKPLKEVSEDLTRQARGVGDEMRQAGQRLTAGGSTAAGSGPAGSTAAGAEVSRPEAAGPEPDGGPPPARRAYDDVT